MGGRLCGATDAMGKAAKITVTEPNPKARFHLGVFTASMPLCVVCAPLGSCLLPRALSALDSVLFDALRCAADLKTTCIHALSPRRRAPPTRWIGLPFLDDG